MKLNRKWLMVIALVMSLTMATAGTLAYLTDRDTVENTFTMGNVDIEVDEEYKQDSELYPGVEVEKKAGIENVHNTSDAWVWMTVSVPTELVDYIDLEWLEGTNVDVRTDVHEDYTSFVVKHTEVLKAGESTDKYLQGVTLSELVDYQDGSYGIYNKETGKFEPLKGLDDLKIIVDGFAMQTDGFKNVQEAYKAYEKQWEEMGNGGESGANGGIGSPGENPPEAKLPTTSWLDNSDTSWYDASKNEYSISTAAELAGLSELVNEQGVTFRGKTVTLTKSVDLGNHLWTPVGQTSAGQFGGTFDGNNKTISNLYIDTTAKDSGTYATGLFGWLNTATVKNTKVDGAVIKGNQYVGVIAGYMESISTCTISNCSVNDAKVTAIHKNNNNCGDKVGVIVGYAGNAGSVVVNCSATKCTVAAGRDAGQIAGAARTEVVTGCTATNVTVSATKGCTGANIKQDIIGRELN